jgi:uncharacterized membrane protein
MSVFELRTGSSLAMSSVQPNSNAQLHAKGNCADIPNLAWWAMLVASGTALATSCYLAWSSITSSPVAGCGSGSVFDCSHVLHSRWSKIFSIPVSVPAIATHLLLLSM